MIVEPKKPGERVQQLGNKTECGLLGFVMRIGGNYEQIRAKYPEEKIVKVKENMKKYYLLGVYFNF